MRQPMASQRGSVAIVVIGVLATLSALAVIVVSIASAGRWTVFSEYAHRRAFYSADAASEASLSWLRTQPEPPPIVDADNNVRVAAGYASLGKDQNFKADIRFVRKHFRPGWSLEYKDYEYAIEADGASVKESEAAVDVHAARLYREGY